MSGGSIVFSLKNISVLAVFFVGMGCVKPADSATYSIEFRGAKVIDFWTDETSFGGSFTVDIQALGDSRFSLITRSAAGLGRWQNFPSKPRSCGPEFSCTFSSGSGRNSYSYSNTTVFDPEMHESGAFSINENYSYSRRGVDNPDYGGSKYSFILAMDATSIIGMLKLDKGASTLVGIKPSLYFFDYDYKNWDDGGFWPVDGAPSMATVTALSQPLLPTVPLPAAAWLYLAALGGVVLARTRGRSAQTAHRSG